MAEARRLVVVGGSLAGLRAVEAARCAGFDGSITLVGAEEHLPYDRPPLSKAYLDAGTPADTSYRDEAAMAELDVELILGEPATGLDPEGREVEVAGRSVPYDALVIATGSTARALSGAIDVEGVHTLRTVDDARAVRRLLDAGSRTVVIGAGFIGSEVASSARKRGLDVTVLEAAPTPLVRAVGEVGGPMVAQLHELNGVDLHCGVAVDAVESLDDSLEVRLADGSSYRAGLVVAGIGATPATAWLDGSGAILDDGVVCDEKLWTGLPGVYAAGDVARWPNELFGRVMRLEHWTSAAEQAAVAALNALGISDSVYSTVPYFWSDWYGTRIQMVGVPAEDEVRLRAGRAEEGKFVVLYREADRLAGALCVGYPALTMKYRRMIASRSSWETALDFPT